jgi:hypothetical protein
MRASGSFAVRSRLVLPLLLTYPLLTCCASLAKMEDMRARAEHAEAELEKAQMFIAGAHDDNAMLQKYGIELDQELMRWQMGSMVQAKREADLRSGCDI